jgi:hypothetical protein
MTPSVTIDRHGREWVYLSITTDPVLSGWEASVDQWATEVTLDTTGAPYTIDGATYTHRVLVAGADCDATPRDRPDHPGVHHDPGGPRHLVTRGHRT